MNPTDYQYSKQQTYAQQIAMYRRLLKKHPTGDTRTELASKYIQHVELVDVHSTNLRKIQFDHMRLSSMNWDAVEIAIAKAKIDTNENFNIESRAKDVLEREYRQIERKRPKNAMNNLARRVLEVFEKASTESISKKEENVFVRFVKAFPLPKLKFIPTK